MNKKQVALLGVPIDLGAHAIGVDIGPQALRYVGLERKLKKADLLVTDLGNVVCRGRNDVQIGNNNYKHLSEVVAVCNKTAEIVDKQLKSGKRVVTLGGDHSLTIGSVAGASSAFKGDLGIIYIDAHGDFNTDKTTLSGNIHGMSFSAVLGYGLPQLVNLYKPGQKILREHSLHVGATDLDDAGEALMKKEQIPMFDMQDMVARGLGDLFGMVLSLCKRVNNVWVSLDLDAIDNLYAPGVGIPSKGGFTHREIIAIAKYIGKKCNVVGLDLVEYNPVHDRNHMTADLAIEISAQLLGTKYSEYTEYMDTQKSQ